MCARRRTWLFKSKPTILASAAVGGPFEGQGSLAADFDLLHNDIWFGQDSFEKAEKVLLEEACKITIQKAGLKTKDIDCFLAGDLMNQIISSSFAARTLGIPFLGLYGACSSAMEGLTLAALIVDGQYGNKVLAGTSSHNSAAEKQNRYPTEYGAQKPPTAQWTVTGAGAVLLGRQDKGIKVTCATLGQVMDMGLSDPLNMGAAMAPAAADTIEVHFRERNITPDYYDLIATGDLGKIGHKIAADLLEKRGLPIPAEIFVDCGALIYKEEQGVLAGGSGCGCCATVTYGHLLKRMARGELNKILIVATGALHSFLSYQQKESIPAIAHAVSMEKE